MEFIKKIWANRYTYAQYLALVATPLSIIGWWMQMQGTGLSTLWALMFCVGLTLTVFAYCLCGLGTAVKSALSIAKWGWFVAPFPYDLLTFVLAFVFSLYAFLFIPIIPVRKAFKENQKKQMADAQ